MTPALIATQAAAGAFQQIAETAGGERARRAAAGALVLRAAEQALQGSPGRDFVLMRARAEVASLDSCAEKSTLQRLLFLIEECLAEPESCPFAQLLVAYACELERTRRLLEADAALTVARSVVGADPEIALHAGRVARKLGDSGRALELYRAARELDGSAGAIARLAAIGEAVVSADPKRRLGQAIRQARRVGDAEAAGVGLEERARLRRAAGKRQGALRDLCAAALRFPDPVDRSRVAHELADLLIAAGDLPAAREALLVALTFGDVPQREHAQSRLHSLSRDLGDRVGMRRWRSFQRPSLVSLSAYRKTSLSGSAAPLLTRWRESMQPAGA